MTKTRLAFLVFILVSASVLLVAGLKSEVFLGDEIIYYRFAKDAFQLGHRPVYDSFYGPVIPPGYNYVMEPAWPIGLALFWRIFGGVSPVAAQIYHTFFFILLIGCTYLLAKKIYGEKYACHTALITATIPMVAAFGILFYTDLPAAALSALLFLLLYKRKYIGSGMALGILYLTKRSGAFFIPAVLFNLLGDRSRTFRQKIGAAFLCFGASLLVVIPDLLWRRRQFGFHLMQEGPLREGPSWVAMPLSAEGLGDLLWERFLSQAAWKIWEVKEYMSSSLLSLRDAFMYFGVSFFFLFFLYFFGRRFEKKDGFFWTPIVSYMFFYTFLLHLAADIRYVLPLVPFLAPLAAKSIEVLSRRWYKISVYGLCLLQFGAASLFICNERRPSEELKEGFEYARTHMPSDALIMYPEANFVELAERKVIWGLGGVLQILWTQSEEEMVKWVRRNSLDYIVVKKDRIYDDREGREYHHGGYPRSFVDRLPKLGFVELAYENKEMSIWKIHPEVLS